MKEYARPQSKTFIGKQIVYESADEFLSYHPNKPYFTEATLYQAEPGDWFQYGDGAIAQLGKKYHFNNTTYCFVTILNAILCKKDGSQPVKNSVGIFSRNMTINYKKIDFDEVDKRKIAVVEDWLFHGKSLIEAISLHYKWKHQITDEVHGKLCSANRQFHLRMFASKFINGSWFDKLMAQDRIIRDRYMSLVGALESNGLSYDFIAKKLKEAIETGSEKERINAINKALDVLQEEERRRNKPGNGILIPFSATDEMAMRNHKQLGERDAEARLLTEGEQGNEGAVLTDDQRSDSSRPESSDEEVHQENSEDSRNSLRHPEPKVVAPQISQEMLDEALKELLGKDEYDEIARVKGISRQVESIPVTQRVYGEGT